MHLTLTDWLGLVDQCEVVGVNLRVGEDNAGVPFEHGRVLVNHGVWELHDNALLGRVHFSHFVVQDVDGDVPVNHRAVPEVGGGLPVNPTALVLVVGLAPTRHHNQRGLELPVIALFLASQPSKWPVSM